MGALWKDEVAPSLLVSSPSFEAAFSVKLEDSFRAALPQRKEQQPASLGKNDIFQAHKVLK